MSEPNPSPSPAPASAAVNTPAPPAVAPPAVDLNQLLLPADWTLAQLEAAARKIYFEDLAPNPPQTPNLTWLDKKTLIIAGTEGGFQKVFGETEGWQQFQHQKTGELDIERLRRAPWIRPVLEMRVPKTKIYSNNHSMKPRQYGSKCKPEKKRIFITLGKEIIYFISLVHTDHGLALGTAFPPVGWWLRDMQAKSTLLGP